jgi:hypothetical protein
MLLAPAAKCAPPVPEQAIPEHREAFEVPWHRIVVEVALHDRFEPSPRLRYRIAHAPVELLLDLSQLGSHALADGRTAHCNGDVTSIISSLSWASHSGGS